MALPPERITVKRRREDDPVEALYIQPKKYRPSNVWTLASIENSNSAYADPAESSRRFAGPQPPRHSDPKIPTIRTTLSSEDIFKQYNAPAKSIIPKREKNHTESPPLTRPLKSGQRNKETTSEPRKFRLFKSSLSISSPYLVSKTPAQKYNKNRKRDLAVFVENRGKVKPAARQQDVSALEGINRNECDTPEPDGIRKKPNATPAERKWRIENWDRPRKQAENVKQGTGVGKNINDPPHEWDYESPELLEQLQQITRQEMQIQEEKSAHVACIPQLKTKPKPPKPRQPAVQCNVRKGDDDDVMTDDLVPEDDDDDYVFDTYVRLHSHPTMSANPTEQLIDPVQQYGYTNMGILIIDEGEDEELWETFGGEIDSDPDWNSEEEDENAEDFYGNDYPEDEVDSDDECGRGAYNYRHGGSDDEEFDEEENSWCDEDAEAKPPWSLQREQLSIGVSD